MLIYSYFLVLLDGWQGWWTGARYDVKIREFAWLQTGSIISRRDSKWLPSLVVYPYDQTCVWLVPLSRYSLGNYWCAEESGFICETNVNNWNCHTCIPVDFKPLTVMVYDIGEKRALEKSVRCSRDGGGGWGRGHCSLTRTFPLNLCVIHVDSSA